MNVMDFYGIDFSKKSKRLSRCFWVLGAAVGYAHCRSLLRAMLTDVPCCGLGSLLTLAVGYACWSPLLWAMLTDYPCCRLCLLKFFAVGYVHWLPLLKAMFIEDLTPHFCGNCPLAVPFLHTIISIISCHCSSNPQESSTVKSMCLSLSLKIKG